MTLISSSGGFSSSILFFPTACVGFRLSCDRVPLLAYVAVFLPSRPAALRSFLSLEADLWLLLPLPLGVLPFLLLCMAVYLN